MCRYERFFKEGEMPKWFQRFDENPFQAISDILILAADLGTKNAAEPAMVLTDWIESIGAQEDFISRIDQAAAKWIKDNWGQMDITGTGSISINSVAWCNLGMIIEVSKSLPHSAQELKARILTNNSFLNELTRGRSYDPLSNAYYAMAEYQNDDSLNSYWLDLCDITDERYWWRGNCGVRGLSKMPAENDRQLITQVCLGLIQFGIELNRKKGKLKSQKISVKREYSMTLGLTFASIKHKLTDDDYRPQLQTVSDFAHAKESSLPKIIRKVKNLHKSL